MIDVYPTKEVFEGRDDDARIHHKLFQHKQAAHQQEAYHVWILEVKMINDLSTRLASHAENFKSYYKIVWKYVFMKYHQKLVLC